MTPSCQLICDIFYVLYNIIFIIFMIEDFLNLLKVSKFLLSKRWTLLNFHNIHNT